MSSLLKSSSPASGAPDLLPAQDIEQLIDNALAIKEDIGIVKNTLSRLESSEQLEAVAGDCKKVSTHPNKAPMSATNEKKTNTVEV